MHAITILQCLKKHGQLLDSEIAPETGIPLDAVRFSLAGRVPRPAPGRKSAPRLKN